MLMNRVSERISQLIVKIYVEASGWNTSNSALMLIECFPLGFHRWSPCIVLIDDLLCEGVVRKVAWWQQTTKVRNIYFPTGTCSTCSTQHVLMCHLFLQYLPTSTLSWYTLSLRPQWQNLGRRALLGHSRASDSRHPRVKEKQHVSKRSSWQVTPIKRSVFSLLLGCSAFLKRKLHDTIMYMEMCRYFEEQQREAGLFL